MGVPSYFSWLLRRYRKAVTDVKVDEEIVVNGETIPVDASAANPNGFETDNLYLDMNGIIHPCTHPEDKAAPSSEEEMLIAICEYIEFIFNVVRPRRLLYMAIDGCAPRAKMNQQRARRFKSAREARELREIEATLRSEFESRNIELPPVPNRWFDSNCITPGTPFMENVATALRYFVARKINDDPAWRGIKVVLTDSNVPGEGEHKMMNFIRHQRAQPGYEPNLRHCIYGGDADLIMLGLATHEPHFVILRDSMTRDTARTSKCHKCGEEGHLSVHCTGLPLNRQSKQAAFGGGGGYKKQPYQFVHLSVMREYLDIEFNPRLRGPQTPFAYDLERIIDDFVFLCFFVGNDFLPHLPTLEIREGAISQLMSVYSGLLSRLGGYITTDGEVDIVRAGVFMSEVALLEPSLIAKRVAHQQREAEKRAARNSDPDNQKSDHKKPYEKNMSAYDRKAGDAPQAAQVATVALGALNKRENNAAAAARLRAELMGFPKTEDDTDAAAAAATTSTATTADVDANNNKRKRDDADVGRVKEEKDDAADDDNEPVGEAADDEESSASSAAVGDGKQQSLWDESLFAVPANFDPEKHMSMFDNALSTVKERFERAPIDSNGMAVDEVDWSTPNFRAQYYKCKFKKELNDEKFFKAIRRAYIEGLCWVMQYYYQGCVSWEWYYPFHYAPFAADLSEVATIEETGGIRFAHGTPFAPFQQLLAVLPPASASHLPEAYRPLMLDPDSPIIDFYPSQFAEDLNGQTARWKAVVLLPFIDQDRLLCAIAAIGESKLSPDEVRRNAPGCDFVGAHIDANPIAKLAKQLYTRMPPSDEPIGVNAEDGLGMYAEIKPARDLPKFGKPFPSPMPSQPSIEGAKNRVAFAIWINPPLKRNYVHRHALLRGTKLPDALLTVNDYANDARADSSYHRNQNSSNVHDRNRPEMYNQTRSHSGRGRGGGYSRGGGVAQARPNYQAYQQEQANFYAAQHQQPQAMMYAQGMAQPQQQQQQQQWYGAAYGAYNPQYAQMMQAQQMLQLQQWQQQLYAQQQQMQQMQQPPTGYSPFGGQHRQQ